MAKNTGIGYRREDGATVVINPAVPIKGLARIAAAEWNGAPQGWVAAWVRCAACGYRHMSVHVFGAGAVECPRCHQMEAREEADADTSTA